MPVSDGMRAAAHDAVNKADAKITSAQIVDLALTVAADKATEEQKLAAEAAAAANKAASAKAAEHPLTKAWKAFSDTQNFKNALAAAQLVVLDPAAEGGPKVHHPNVLQSLATAFTAGHLAGMKDAGVAPVVEKPVVKRPPDTGTMEIRRPAPASVDVSGTDGAA